MNMTELRYIVRFKQNKTLDYENIIVMAFLLNFKIWTVVT